MFLFFSCGIWWLFRLLFIVCLFIPNMMLLIKLEWSRLWFKIIKIPSASHSLLILGKCIFVTATAFHLLLQPVCNVLSAHYTNLMTLFSEHFPTKSNKSKRNLLSSFERCWNYTKPLSDVIFFSLSSSFYLAVQAINKAIALVLISFFSVFYHQWCKK